MHWSKQFHSANGSWQRLHPRWKYTFWNDSAVFKAQYAENPNMEEFVARHFEWFLPAWRRLCFFIMRLDVRRLRLARSRRAHACLDVRGVVRHAR